MSATDMIYLDNAASTVVAPEVADVVRECMLVDYGNPSSAHHMGISAERRVRKASSIMMGALGVLDGDVGRLLWTSGGTESDAMAILGAARGNARVGKKIVISAIEHPAVRASATSLENDGYEVVIVPVGRAGTVDATRFANACAGASVAALMLVNNEIGVIQPVAQAAKLAREINPELHFHCDAVQALGKLGIDAIELGVDSIAVAAHKLHGPKGCGALWLRRSAKLQPLWQGGGQQHGLRSGTLNVPGIAGFGTAVTLADHGMAQRATEHSAFADQLKRTVDEAGVSVRVNGEGAPRAPHILSLAIRDVPAEPLLHVMESRGVMVSAGSACAERDRKPSPVLEAIELPPEYGTLRLSFGRYTTQAQVDSASEILSHALASFR